MLSNPRLRHSFVTTSVCVNDVVGVFNQIRYNGVELCCVPVCNHRLSRLLLNSRPGFFAAVPPRFAIAWLSSKEPGFSFLEISVEVDSDRKNPLMNPFVAVTLFLISLQCAVNGKFRINGFFYALSADLCKPQLKRFRFWGWNRLDNAKQLLGVGNIGLVTLTVCREHFQLTTFCRQLASIFFQARFQDAPIFGGKRVSG